MNKKLPVAVLLVACTVSFLIYSASKTTARAVVTVDELVAQPSGRERIQLGARVVEDSEIQYQSQPERTVQFTVMDIHSKEQRLPVLYHGAMPDTLRPGRDVILQGDYDGTQFVAKSLQTQCPSKYEPPIPE